MITTFAPTNNNRERDRKTEREDKERGRKRIEEKKNRGMKFIKEIVKFPEVVSAVNNIYIFIL